MLMKWIPLLVVLQHQIEGVQSVASDSQKDLINFLFANHTPIIRPVLNQSESTMVIFELHIVQLLDVDERSQVLKTKLWIKQRWRDELLTWNPALWAGLRDLHFDAEKVWVPDMHLYNSVAEPSGAEMFKTKVKVHHDGMCMWYSPVQLSSSCIIDVSRFPFDKQHCILRIGPWTNTIKSVDMVISPKMTESGVPHYTRNSEWDLTRTYAERNVDVYGENESAYVTITFIMVLQRKPLFFLFNAIIPCIVLMLLVVVSFLLPPESGERISLTITVFLAVTVFQQLISSTLPRNSESVPNLFSFYALVMFSSAMSLLANCFVLRLYYSKPERPIPRWVQSILLRRKKSLLPTNDSTKNEQKDNYEASPNTATKHEVQNNNGNLVIGNNAADGHGYSASASGHVTLLSDERTEAFDWPAVAAAVDRILFWSFFLGSVGAATAILLPIFIQWE